MKTQQIIICGNCSHPINSLGINVCPICGSPLVELQSKEIERLKKIFKDLGGRRSELEDKE